MELRLKEAPIESGSPKVIEATSEIVVTAPSPSIVPFAPITHPSSSFILVKEGPGDSPDHELPWREVWRAQFPETGIRLGPFLRDFILEGDGVTIDTELLGFGETNSNDNTTSIFHLILALYS